MTLTRSTILRTVSAPLLALAALTLLASPAQAQFMGYGGMGGIGYGGYGGMAYGGMAYGGYGGMGYGGMGYGGMGYGGLGYGGLGYGGYGGMAYGGLGYDGYGGMAYGGYGGIGYGGLGYGVTPLGGIGYPGISSLNPYFSAGLSPLAVENAIFERSILGRTTPGMRSVRGLPGVSRPTTTSPVGTGTFGNR